MAKKSRLVRGETGALFEVDAAMVEEPSVIDGPFRAPAGPVSANAIKPAGPRRRYRRLVGIAIVVALVSGYVYSSIGETRRPGLQRLPPPLQGRPLPEPPAVSP